MKSNIVLIGLMGCGKTTIGKSLSNLLEMPFVDVDEEIEKQYGPIKKIFEKGEDYFRDLESFEVESLSHLENTVISTGGGVVLRPSNMEVLRGTGTIFYLNRPLKDILKTVDPSNRPLLKDGKEALYKLHSEREPLYLHYSDHVIEASNLKQAVSAIASLFMGRGL